MIRRRVPLLVLPAVLLAFGLAACGEKEETTAGGAVERVNLMLDYLPNADHAGIYAAIEEGEFKTAKLDVKPRTPPDPSAPLKLLAAGRADLAISYEPELLLARAKGADLVSIGALVQTPLTSLISLGSRPVRSPASLEGKKVGTSGIPYQDAYLRTILEQAGADPDRTRPVDVGFNLVPTLVSKRVDAVLGMFWNVEGVELERQDKKPVILRMEEIGVPTYNELDRRRAGAGRPRPRAAAAALHARARARARARAQGCGHRRRRAREVQPRPRSPAAARADPGDAAGLLPGRQGSPVRLSGSDRVAALRRVDGRQRAPAEHPDLRARVHQRVPPGRGDLSADPARRTVSPAQARRLALHAQGLAGPAPPGGSECAHPDAIAALTQRIGCLQLDPVSAVARSPLLVLFARLGAVRDDALDRAAYEQRSLFDAWAHEASLVATADLPLHRWAMRTWLHAPGPRAERARSFLAANAAFCEELLDELRERGPLRARDLENRSAEPWRHGWWTDEVSGRQTMARLLHVLWVTGRVGVGGRMGTERLWDIFERCVPPEAAAVADLSDAEAEREAALRAVQMLGVARAGHVRAHFLRRRYRRLPETLAQLVAAGRLERLAVEGLRGEWFATPQALAGLAALAPGARTTALSPFDNLLCDRSRTAELFGFEHRLEIYVPAAQRRWGYYVLPILHRERIVARADLAVDREAGLLRVLAMHREPAVRRSAALDRAVTRALERLAAWRGADGVQMMSP